MFYIESAIQWFTDFISTYVLPSEVLIVSLLGTGIFLTIRLGFIQIRRFTHGCAVASGKYDHPDKPGDVSHFQALTTALSATVGVGNIAGVAIAIHWGGPGALFWMWCTAVFGMTVKYVEVTLSMKYRQVDEHPEDATAMEGTVSGGPMYYIEKGMGVKFLAVFFAGGLLLTSFLTGNAIQANTVSDLFYTKFGMPTWQTGLISSAFVAVVIFGGIKRIGRVTSILAPLMALIYVFGAITILMMNTEHILPSFQMIFTEAFNPVSGVAGTGVGVFMMTLMWGVKRGLFSNEAGQGSAPIAHAAAQTDEPVSEGVVALLGPFIDTLVICTLTGLVILTTQSWNERRPTKLVLSSGDSSYVNYDESGSWQTMDPSERILVIDGKPDYASGKGQYAWNDVPVDELFLDPELKHPFDGEILTEQGAASLYSNILFSQQGEIDVINESEIWVSAGGPESDLIFEDGKLIWSNPNLKWDSHSMEMMYLDADRRVPYTGHVTFASDSRSGKLEVPILYGEAVETSAPLTAMAFSKDLGVIGAYIVILSVALFAVSTAISWSYYGDRCAYYLFGKKSIMPYKIIYVCFHMVGAMASLNVIWGFGDVALSIVTIPNLIALLFLSGQVAKMSKSYFERRPWENKDLS